MKTKLLLSLACIAGITSAEAQNGKYATRIPAVIANQTLPFNPIMVGAETTPLQSSNPFVAAPGKNHRATLATIGNTTYDLQTNTAIQNRILRNSDGTMSAVWTTSAAGTLAAPDRGTGYNYYNGTDWMIASSTRIETVRSGWPSITGGTTYQELVVNHNSGTTPLNLVTRPVKGTGSWTESTIPGLATGEFVLWPRTIIGGANGNTVHMMAVTAPTGNGGTIVNGIDGALVYSRSINGGVSWDIQHALPTGMDATNYFSHSGDAYAIDVRGDVVAMVSGGFTQDFALWKSIDNGTTWTRTVAMPFPIPAFNPSGNITDVDGDMVADTIDTDDGSVAVLIDNNNMVHIWTGAMRVLKTDATTAGVTYFPGTDALLYWNESMGANPPVMIAEGVDIDGNGTYDVLGIANYQRGITTMPSAAIDAVGNLYCVYSSIVENTTNGLTPVQSYRNVYVTTSNNGGATWSSPYNISDSDFDEGVFGTIARSVDTDIHVIWQSDTEPGLAARGDLDPFTQNEILYTSVPTSLIVGINDIKGNISGLNLYPNPASEKLNISFDLNTPSIVNIEVMNIMGQMVQKNKFNIQNTGNHTVELNINDLSAGMYLINTTIGDNKVTRKLVVR